MAWIETFDGSKVVNLAHIVSIERTHIHPRWGTDGEWDMYLVAHGPSRIWEGEEMPITDSFVLFCGRDNEVREADRRLRADLRNGLQYLTSFDGLESTPRNVDTEPEPEPYHEEFDVPFEEAS